MSSNLGGYKRGRRQRSKADAKNGNEKKRGKGGRTSPYTDKEKVTVPLFLQKTYKMIDTCEPSIACWTEDGEMFVVKNPTIFARDVIPQYFDHSKFTSFARQLNFYGFRKMQIKPLRNDDFDQETSKHVTFHNEKFKRGRHDLLSQIQRSTKGGAATANQEQQAEIQELKGKVDYLQSLVYELHNRMQDMEDHHQRQWEAFIHQFQQSNHLTNMPNGDHDQQNKPSQASHDQNLSTSGGRKTDAYPNDTPSYDPIPDIPRREAQRVTIIEEPKEAKPRQPTLKPHPNSKTLPDVGSLPPPPRADSTFREASRGISFMRGFSKEYADIGLFETARQDDQVNIPPPNGNINEMQQPDLSSFQQRYFQSMMSDPDIRLNQTQKIENGVTSTSTGTPNRHSVAHHAAKNMETLQNLNINCYEIEKPEMKRVSTVNEPLPPL